jgi:hypothetical protein
MEVMFMIRRITFTSKTVSGALIGLLSAALMLVSGCSSGRVYMSTLRNYPDCVTQAQISRAKADACMDSTDKADFNACLADRKVPQNKIDVLNRCVDSHRRGMIGNLF